MSSLAHSTSILAITQPEELASIEQELTPFLDKNSANPFLLYPFIPYLMLKAPKDEHPLVLVIKQDNKIVGFVALQVKDRFGFRIAESLLKPTGSPDIIATPEYRQEVSRKILWVLLSKFRCKSITLTLPAESANLQALKEECTKKSLKFSQFQDQGMNHCILKIDGSWANYQKTLSGNFRARLKKTERQLSAFGQWQITANQIDKDENTTKETLEKIRAIESESWKENWRLHNGSEKQDQDLEGIWKTSRLLARTNPLFKTYVWILELNNKPVAYSLVLCHREKAIIAKTSYSQSVGAASPGMYIMNAAIQALFNKGEIQTIDFLTALPFMRKWRPIVLSRTKLNIMPKTLSVAYSVLNKVTNETPIASTIPKIETQLTNKLFPFH